MFGTATPGATAAEKRGADTPGARTGNARKPTDILRGYSAVAQRPREVCEQSSETERKSRPRGPAAHVQRSRMINAQPHPCQISLSIHASDQETLIAALLDLTASLSL